MLEEVVLYALEMLDVVEGELCLQEVLEAHGLVVYAVMAQPSTRLDGKNLELLDSTR